MCGLVGVFGDMYANHVKYFKQALVADYFRGKHSTGITCVKMSGAVFNKKLALDPINFLDLKSVDDNIVNTNTLMMGHNRHATLGGVNAANAHPFEHGNITLMHNGTLSNKYALQTKYKAPIFGTDSELVCWLINEHGVEAIIPELIGAFALTWHDASDGSFNFIRNDERPMAMALADDILMYASEGNMLQWLILRNNMDTKNFKMFNPKKGVHHKFSYKTKVVSLETQEVELYVTPKYQAVEYKPYQYHNTKQEKTGGGGSSARSEATRGDARFQQYSKEHGGTIKRGDTIFCYVDKVVKQGYQADTHFDLEMSLVNSPYTTVKVFYVPNKSYKDIEQAFVVRATVTNVYLSGGDPYMIIDREFDIINEVTDKYYTDYEKLVSDDAAQIIEVVVDKYGNKTDKKDEGNIVMIGGDNDLITTAEFRKATEKGCFVCKQKIDAEKDIQDGQETMIVGKSTAICESCIDVYEQHLKTGVQ